MDDSLTLADSVEKLATADARHGFSFVLDAKDLSQLRWISFPEIYALTTRYAGALQAAGLRRGDRLALILPDNEQFLLTFLAALRIGVIAVPITPMHGFEQMAGHLQQVTHLVGKSGAKVLVTTSKLKTAAESFGTQPKALGTLLAIEALAGFDATMRPEKITPDDVAFLQFTSGSTALPKGVIVTHRNLHNNIRFIGDRYGVTSSDVAVSWLPMFHDMGLIGNMLMMVCRQIPSVYLAPHMLLQRPLSWLKTIANHRGTWSVAPNFAYALCVKRGVAAECAGLDLSSWRTAGCGAEPIRPGDIRSFVETFEPFGFRPTAFAAMYGMAEATLAITLGMPGDGMKTVALDAARLAADNLALPAQSGQAVLELAGCGYPDEQQEVAVFAIEDEASQKPLADGQVGEVRVRGPTVTAGYWEDEAQTQKTFGAGWLRTGDMGFFRDGQLFVCGRHKEVIILSARNYYPQDIEHVASSVPGVRKGNVIAFGTGGVFAGGDHEMVVVATEVSDPKVFDATAVIRAIQTALGIAAEVVALNPGQLPKTSSGKLQRTKARALYESGQLRTSFYKMEALRDPAVRAG